MEKDILLSPLHARIITNPICRLGDSTSGNPLPQYHVPELLIPEPEESRPKITVIHRRSTKDMPGPDALF